MQPDSRELSTPRLRLRPLLLADARPLARLRDDPEVARHQSWQRYSEADAEALIHNLAGQRPGTAGAWFQWAIERRSDAVLLGDCGLKTCDDPRLGELGYTLGRAHQRQGFASEAVRAVLDLAFRELGMHRVSASIDVDNLASIALCERLGLRREAHFRRSVWFKGAWCDDIVYAILGDEWLAR